MDQSAKWSARMRRTAGSSFTRSASLSPSRGLTGTLAVSDSPLEPTLEGFLFTRAPEFGFRMHERRPERGGGGPMSWAARATVATPLTSPRRLNGVGQAAGDVGRQVGLCGVAGDDDFGLDAHPR